MGKQLAKQMADALRFQEPVEEHAHRDNRGSTHRYSCGCSVVFRGTSMRWRGCDFHGRAFVVEVAPTEGEGGEDG